MSLISKKHSTVFSGSRSRPVLCIISVVISDPIAISIHLIKNIGYILYLICGIPIYVRCILSIDPYCLDLIESALILIVLFPNTPQAVPANLKLLTSTAYPIP